MFKAHITVIEDNPSIRRLLYIKLMKENYNVTAYDNGKDGLLAIRRNMPDLLILDVMLPEMTGYDVLDILRKDPETHDIKVLMLTSLTDFEDIKKGMDYGVDDYLGKPFEMNDLMKRITRLLAK